MDVKKIHVKLSVYVVNIILFALSCYIIWGWMTLSDIKKFATKNNLDNQKLMSFLYYGYIDELSSYSKTNHSKTVNKATQDTQDTQDNQDTQNAKCNFSKKELYLCLRRYLHTNVKKHNEKNFYETGAVKSETTTVTIIPWLYPFLCISETVANFLFCFGIGFLLSFLLVLIKVLKTKENLADKYLLIRPFAGGLAASSLYIIIIAGGTLLWNNVSDIKSFSLGIISVLGAVYCEKFEHLISLSPLKTGNSNTPE